MSLGTRRLQSDICTFSSLKRTMDIMFGGKMVCVCGYGEVSLAVCRLGMSLCALYELGGGVLESAYGVRQEAIFVHLESAV